MNKWLISREIESIRDDQQKLVDRWNKVAAFERIQNPMLKTAAAQVLENQRNEQSERADDPEDLWTKSKYSFLIRLFKHFEEEKHEWSVGYTELPEGANLVGLRDDNRTIILEEGQDTVWTVKPVNKKLRSVISYDACQDLRTVCGIDPLTEVTAIMAMEVAMEIVSEIKKDLEKLYCKNNILQYNYCIHSFSLAPTVLDPNSFCPRTPFLMKYIKTATFGD